MAEGIAVGPVPEEEFETLLPLISAYQATAPDNHTAQRLYDSLPTERSTWLEYELDV